MHDEDALHPNTSLQEKLGHIYTLRREGRVNFEDNSHYLELLRRLDNPHKNLPPVIHIAGTNGKGSTLAMLRAMLEADGYKVHAYTSPHLRVFNERLYLAGQHISDEELEAALDEIYAINGDNPVTFFEFTTALAFHVFSQHPADIILLETGMGGRLDCTNIVPTPLACVITPISFDHMEFLGTTLTAIAREKAGIMKAGVPCILAPQEREEDILPVFEDMAQQIGCPLSLSGQDWQTSGKNDHMIFQNGSAPALSYPRPNLRGDHQIVNAGTALATLDAMRARFPVSEAAKAHGLTHIHWPGRMERMDTGAYHALLPPEWELWFDGAHNVAGAKAIAGVLEHWQNTDPRDVHIFLGMKENKDVTGVTALLQPYATSFHPIQIGEDLTPYLTEIARNSPSPPARILVCGSLYGYF